MVGMFGRDPRFERDQAAGRSLYPVSQLYAGARRAAHETRHGGLRDIDGGSEVTLSRLGQLKIFTKRHHAPIYTHSVYTRQGYIFVQRIRLLAEQAR